MVGFKNCICFMSVVVFIIFCMVFGLYFKGNVQFNLIIWNIVMMFNDCNILIEFYFV